MCFNIVLREVNAMMKTDIYNCAEASQELNREVRESVVVKNN